jgi:hypothetical protein
VATWVWIVIALAIVVLAVIGWLVWSNMRTRRLRTTFGSEYDRAVDEAPSQRDAEATLDDRRKRRDDLDIRPLSAEARTRYADDWRAVQARFVDDPVGAVGDADGLVERVMAERGYPMDDFDAQADLISVDYPEVVENYRSAHGIHGAYDRGDASTEDLRQAMVHYRSLFVELLDLSGDEAETTESTRMEAR